MTAATAAAATHAELARLIARGDRRRAASLLVRDHAPAVLSLCRAMVRDPRLAEDLSQDAFTRAFGALDGFRGEASPRTWLLRIARNRCLDHLDHARRAPWADHADPEPDDHAADEPPPYDLLARREDAEQAMSVLGESERALVVLHFGHGVGYPELADSFGLREGAVRMRISRALARMRGALDFEGSRAATETEAQTRASAGWLEDDVAETTLAEAAGRATSRSDAFADADEDDGESVDTDLNTDLNLALDDELEATTQAAPEELDELEETTQATPAELEEPAWAASAAPGGPPAVFDALRDDVSPDLRRRLDALAAAV
ncbi:MAG TPA: sigma-70 family RNA polymerase sigma factor [Kofleriaceae bacterium]|nr:sigma-70 family RNA polymerase sigma factor [Kofleriaceae bacterium]